MRLRAVKGFKTRSVILTAGFVQPYRLEDDQVVLHAFDLAQSIRRLDSLHEAIGADWPCIAAGTHCGDVVAMPQYSAMPVVSAIDLPWSAGIGTCAPCFGIFLRHAIKIPKL